MALDEVHELRVVAVDAEAVGQRERDLAPGAVGGRGGLAEGFLGAGRVPQIAFQVGDLRVGDQRLVDVLRTQLHAGAEVGVHGALGVRRHQDQAARRRGAAMAGRRLEMHAGGADVVAEDLAELVAVDLADVGPPAAQRRDAGHGVAGGTARHLDARTHAAVQLLGAGGVDQRHRPLLDPVGREKGVVGMGDHVDDGVADAGDVEFGRGHGRSLEMLGKCGVWTAEEIRARV